MIRDLRDKIRSLEQKQEEQFQYIQTIIENSKDDNKQNFILFMDIINFHRLLFEKLKIVANNNSNQIDLLTHEHEKMNSQLNETRNKTINNSNTITDVSKKLIDMEENLKLSYQELANKIQDVKSTFASFRENIKSDTQNILRSQNEISDKIEDMSARLNDRFESGDLLNNQKFLDLENIMNQIQNDFQVRFLISLKFTLTRKIFKILLEFIKTVQIR